MESSGGALIQALGCLDEALHDVLTPALGGGGISSVSDDELLALTRLGESVGRLADGLRVTTAGELSHRSRTVLEDDRLSARLGCANPIELITRLTGVSASTAKDRQRIGAAVAPTVSFLGEPMPAPFPALHRAIADGSIGYDTASIIVRTLGAIADRCDPREIDAATTELVAAASATDGGIACTADDTRIQAKVWALVLDPDGVLPDYERALRKRSVTMGRERDGMVPLSGALLPDVAAQLQRLFHANLSPRVDDHLAPVPAGPSFREEPADPSAWVPLDDERTRGQKQHDALAAILGVAARSAESPSIGGAPPTLMVTIAAADLHRDAGLGIIEGTDTTVPSCLARQIACCGGIQRVILADDARIIELGGPQRVFSGQQRRAITVRDGECVIPSCHVPAAWCEIHHTVEHSRGGPTHTDNGVTLCWWHHRTLDTSGWHVRMMNGVPETKAPYWIDSDRQWRPVAGSILQQRERLRRRAGPG